MLGFGPPRQNVRHGGQLHHGATVRAQGGALFQNNTDVIHCMSFEMSVWCYVSICEGIFNQKREVKTEHTHTVEGLLEKRAKYGFTVTEYFLNTNSRK